MLSSLGKMPTTSALDLLVERRQRIGARYLRPVQHSQTRGRRFRARVRRRRLRARCASGSRPPKRGRGSVCARMRSAFRSGDSIRSVRISPTIVARRQSSATGWMATGATPRFPAAQPTECIGGAVMAIKDAARELQWLQAHGAKNSSLRQGGGGRVSENSAPSDSFAVRPGLGRAADRFLRGLGLLRRAK